MSIASTDNNILSDITSSIEKSLASDNSFSNLRTAAFAEFQKLGLPVAKTEEYKYTPITKALEKNFNFNSSNAISNVDVQAYSIPGLEADTLVFINGRFSIEKSNILSSDSEITILTLNEALSKKSELVNNHIGKYANDKADGFTAWNTAAWTDGLFIHVSDNIIAKRPVVILHVQDASEEQVISINRNLIVVGKNSTLTVLEKSDSLGKSADYLNVVTEVAVDENSEFNFYSVQNNSGNHYQSNLKQIHQARSSRVNTFTFTLNGKLVRNNLRLCLNGEGIESHMYGLYLLNGDTLADNHTVVDHQQPNSYSNELYKGIMDDRSKGVFNGKIYVRPLAQKTNAFQANRNILLSDNASVNTKPQLEIWADDVKCSHGCTSGQLDEEALFYLRSRGIQKEEARAMMLYAFAAQLLEQVKHPVLKSYLDEMIRQRLHQNN